MSLRCVVLVALWSSLAVAQVPGFDLERLTLNPGARETMVLTTGDGLDAGSLRVSLWLHYEHNPLVLGVNGVRAGAFISSRLTTQLLGAYAVTHWAEVSLALPVVLFQAGDDLSAYGVAPPTATAAGALTLQGRFTLLRQSRGAPIDLAGTLGLALPTGVASALTRDPGAGVAFTPKVGAGYRIVDVVRVGAELGVLVRGAQVLGSGTGTSVADEVGSTFTWGAAVSTTFLPVHLELSLRGDVPFTHAPAGVEVLLGARYRFGDFEVSALGGPGLGRAPGTPAFRLLAGFTWAPTFATQAHD